jgi:predicted lipoprotein with Yx(FWY)xxD motif
VRHPSVPAVATLAAAAVLAAGCGSSNSTTTAASSPPASATATQSTAAATGTSTAPAAGAGVTVSAKSSKNGTILAAGPKRLTVYLFEADHGSSSSCSGACAHVWPPVTTTGAPSAHGPAITGDLGTITRSDGTMQVTYKGHPLYYYVRDGDSGDAYGQGIASFGASWYVLSPKGGKIDQS